MELDPNDYYTLRLKSDILYDLGEYEKALRIYEEATNKREEFDNTYEKVSDQALKARILVALKRYDEALDIISNKIPFLIEKDDTINEKEFYIENYYEIQTFKLKATIYYQQEKFNEALITINKDIAYLEVTHQYEESIAEESLLLRAKILHELKEFEELMIVIKKFMPFKLQDPSILYQISKITFKISPILSYYAINKAVNLEPKDKKFIEQLENVRKIPQLLSELENSSTDLLKGIELIINKKVFLSDDELIRLLNQKYIDIDLSFIETFIPILIRDQVLKVDGNNIQLTPEYEKFLKRSLERLSSMSIELKFFFNLVEIYLGAPASGERKDPN